MKILITNPDALINPETNSFYEGIQKVLDDFNSVESQQTIVVSVETSKLSSIPEEMQPFAVNGKARGGRLLVNLIQEKLSCDISEILVLGCKQIDVGLAANSKLLLLRADYAEEHNSGELIYRNGYGIKIKDANALKLFFNKFIGIKQPWYYKCQVSDKTYIYSLTNANTIHRSSDITKIADKFRSHLKNGDDSFKEEFLVYFLVSTYDIVNEFLDVDFWGIYPSSNSTENPDLEYYKEKARQTYGSRAKDSIFIRHKNASKRHSKSKDERLATGADEELETLHLNTGYKNKLAGKTVCIIDDFTNIGSSCEAARALLEAAGVAKVIFITMGKFGEIYQKYDYKIEGDPFGTFNFTRTKSSFLTGEFNDKSDLQFVESLGELVK